MKNTQRLWLIIFLLLAIVLVAIVYKSARKEFQPEKDSLFKITFSYPVSWNWREDIPYDDIPPSVTPPPSERIVLENGSISIQVYVPSNPQAQMQEWMDAYQSRATIRSDTTIQIDGYNARWLTVLATVYPPPSEPQIDEVICLLTKDRFYIIDLFIPESEVDGNFHKQFEDLVKSINVLQ